MISRGGPRHHQGASTLTKVVAVVVTYNRRALLSQCLDSLAAQTRPLDGIVIIDNASTDDTPQWLKSEWGQRIKGYSLSKNIGAAGGFSAGLRLAFKEDADFFWVMDDDLFPHPDALDVLLKADAALAERRIPRAYLVSSILSAEGEVTNVPSIDKRKNKDGYENWPALLDLGLVPVDRGTFTSLLLPRAQLAEHGLPVRQMFIWGDDTDYTMRLTKRSPGYIVGKSKSVHGRVVAGRASIFTETDKTRIGYHQRRVRNEVYIARHHYSFVRTMGRHGLTALRLLAKGQFEKAWIIVSGAFEGLSFNPAVEPVTTPIEELDPAVKTI
jgi:GT2 family glycosyltransferase